MCLLPQRRRFPDCSLLESRHGLRGAWSEIAVYADCIAKLAESLLDDLYVRTLVS